MTRLRNLLRALAEMLLLDTPAIRREPECSAPGCISDPSDGHRSHVNARGESWRDGSEVTR